MSIIEQLKDTTKRKKNTLKRVGKMKKIAIKTRNKALTKKANIIEGCSIILDQVKNKSGQLVLTGRHCKNHKYCTICGNIRSYNISHTIFEYVKENKHQFRGKYFYWITIGLEHQLGWSLKDQLKECIIHRKNIVNRFQKSNRKGYKSKSFFNGDGMIISLEIAYNSQNGRNPHMNIVLCTEEKYDISSWKKIDGKMWGINTDLISERKDISGYGGGPAIVNIRNIEKKELANVLGYITKFNDSIDMKLEEYMSVVEHSRYRLFETYGVFKGRDTWEKKGGRFIPTGKKFGFDFKKGDYI